MSLKFDIERGVNNGNTNFSCQLFRLMQKADMFNYGRLASAFPNAAVVFEAWKAGTDVPDLPYDGSN